MKNKGRRRVVFGSILLLIAVFLPWGKVSSFLGTIKIAGYQGRGLLAAGVGLVLLIGGLVTKGKPGKRYSVAGAILAILAGLSTLWAWSRVILAWADSAEGISVSGGLGIWVAALGALIAFIGGLTKVPAEPEGEPENDR